MCIKHKNPAKETWIIANARLNDLYRQNRRDREKGYDSPDSNDEIAAAEKAEHDAWIAYRDTM